MSSVLDPRASTHNEVFPSVGMWSDHSSELPMTDLDRAARFPLVGDIVRTCACALDAPIAFILAPPRRILVPYGLSETANGESLLERLQLDSHVSLIDDLDATHATREERWFDRERIRSCAHQGLLDTRGERIGALVVCSRDVSGISHSKAAALLPAFAHQVTGALELSSALSRAELRVQETRHSAGNRLQTLAALLGLQLRAATDEGARHALLELETRMLVVSWIQNASAEEGLDGIRMLKRLVTHLLRGHRVDLRPTVFWEVGELRLMSAQAMPLLLIAAEVLSVLLTFGEAGIRIVLSESGSERRTLELSTHEPIRRPFDLSPFQEELVTVLTEELAGSFSLSHGTFALTFPLLPLLPLLKETAR